MNYGYDSFIYSNHSMSAQIISLLRGWTSSEIFLLLILVVQSHSKPPYLPPIHYLIGWVYVFHT